MPYMGTAIFLSLLINMTFLSIVDLCECLLSTIYAKPASFINFSGAQMAIMFCVSLVLIYTFNRRKGVDLMGKFENEGELSRKKRKKEFFYVIAFFFFTLFGSVIWRICLG